METEEKLCFCGCGKKCNHIYIHGHNHPKHTEDFKKKLSERQRGENNISKNKNVKDKIRSSALLRFKDKKNHPMYGKKHKEESKIQESLTKKINYISGKTRAWNKNKSCLFQVKEAISKANKGKHLSPLTEFKKGHKFTKEELQKILEGLLKRPTSYEQKISDLCITNNLPFIYTGNGTFLIGHKNPDFVNKKDRVAIEVYHKYFKIRDFGSCENYEKQRSEYFNKYGYKTIFIRTEEIEAKNWKELCLNKLNKFSLKGGHL